jgi:hypothetical protein
MNFVGGLVGSDYFMPEMECGLMQKAQCLNQKKPVGLRLASVKSNQITQE